jgi:hypothetical protein
MELRAATAPIVLGGSRRCSASWGRGDRVRDLCRLDQVQAALRGFFKG